MMLRTGAMRALGCICAWMAVGCVTAQSPTTSDCLELVTDDSGTIARVGEASISVDQIASRLEEQGSGAVRRYSDRERLREFVEDQIRFELLVRAGLERGLARDPEVVQAARTVMVRKLLKKDLGPSAFAAELPEEQVVAYYNVHKNEYMQPEIRRVDHIQLLPTQDGRAEATNILAKLQKRPTDERFFHDLVVRHSTDVESRSSDGALPFKSREELTEEFGPSFASEVFRIPPGSWANEPVQSTRGWHVVKVASRREELHRSINDVRDDIRERLLEGRRSMIFDKYLSEIRQRYPVALYDERLDDVLSRVMGATGTESPGKYLRTQETENP
ncbi:MAG: hypothetical protein A2341_26965 [Deltaproteobacteria bacterium RIFOXYB12_FULL_58_9]|nr:MAG: hypothetical protein A2341_26965 [Deltaproteobacteria bacterium RIFOXYB12_FULL_58_9]